MIAAQVPLCTVKDPQLGNLLAWKFEPALLDLALSSGYPVTR